eukprot:gnl/TRDRNA2_/TRDRNA2_41903_c0_seq1.p1 gnl/TRDRNA2_/TRDRNA2_41903_c0~~gnl/TRDRNA2_/TRDRNA2_41903_c0_seq1.p1  ORF type:complete len:355 (-),score=67.53 gnl/TRDRNA2_/TRDRNA2_41903_c0_seq1:134-1198(-)
MVTLDVAWDLTATGQLHLFKDQLDTSLAWNSTHFTHGTFMMAFFPNYFYGRFAEKDADKSIEKAQKLVRCLSELGASPFLAAPAELEPLYLVFENKDDASKTEQVKVARSGKSAAVVLAQLRVEVLNHIVQRKSSKWTHTLARTEAILETFRTMPSATKSCAKVLVPEALIDLLEKIRCHPSWDVHIVCQDAEVVKCHSLILSSASRVLAAMLSGHFLEGKRTSDGHAELRVPETKDAVSTLLDLLYTASLHEDPSRATCLQAVELASRWGLDMVVSSLERELVRGIAAEGFDELASAAVRMQLPDLQHACRAFAKSNAVVKKRFEADQLSGEALECLGSGTDMKSNAKKRRIA